MVVLVSVRHASLIFDGKFEKWCHKILWLPADNSSLK